MNKDGDIFHNGAGMWASILSLTGLIKAGISNLTGYNLTLSGQLTTSDIICYGYTSISSSLNSYNIICKNNLNISGYLTVSGSIYCNSEILTGIMSAF